MLGIKVNYGQYLRFIGYMVLLSLLIILGLDFAISKNQSDINFVESKLDTIETKYYTSSNNFLNNDQIIAEELLDQKDRIEIIEAQLGITEAGSYDNHKK